MPEVSIIIPIYNSSETLCACLNAVQSQYFSDFEVWLCDDGSTDNSRNLCQQYVAMDGRFHLLALQHNGVSMARNAGLTMAQGNYIAFVDSDDIPQRSWLGTLMQTALQDGLSVCGYAVNNTEGVRQYGTADLPDWDFWVQVSPSTFIEDLFSNQRMYQGYIWNKLFSRHLIETGVPLRFDEKIAYNEDRLFLFWYLYRCNTVWYTGRECYHYLQKSGAPQFSSKLLSELTAFHIMCETLKKRQASDALFYAERDCFRGAATLLHSSGDLATPTVRQYLANIVLQYRRYAESFNEYPPSQRELFLHAVTDATHILRPLEC